jgi:cell division protein ZapA
MQDKKTYELTFGGLPFKLRSSHDEATVNELVEFVEYKLKQAMSATKSGSFQSAAVLAALNIAEELILLKRQALDELNRIQEKTLKISQELENSRGQSSASDKTERQIHA